MQGFFWVGLVYSYFDKELLARFNGTFSISDPVEYLVDKINRQVDHPRPEKAHQEQLSDRERDVLIRLVKGLSNKEIADALNISIHTVGSHRKNIMEKTGIKSLSGLTIYAISMNIIPIDTSYI
jgi:DNA-binding NarL/FixJ family response regulator